MLDIKSETQQVKAEMIAVAFSHLQLASVAVVINSLVLSMALWHVIEHSTIVMWFASMVFVSLLRYYSAIRFKEQSNLFSIEKWEKIFLFGVVISALIWASASVLLFAKESIMHQAMLIIVLAGMSAGAVSSLASVIRAIQIFLLLLLIPIILQLVLQNSELHYWIAALITLFLVLVLIVSKRFNENNRKAIESRLMFEAAKEELYLTSERFETVFKEAPVGIFLYDVDLKILEVNQEFSEILDAPIDYLIGLDMSQLPDKRIFSTLHAVIDKIEGFYEGEYTVNYNHHEIWISMRTSPLFDSEGHVIGGIGIVTDITKRMHDQQKIHHQAYHDALTDVPNRMMLTQRLNQELVRYKRHSIISGLLFLDLDHFKDINDSLGHHIGDELLIEVAYRLKSIIREEDIVSRLGGDEFVILLADLGTKEISAVNKAELIAQKVHAALETPFHIQHHLLTISTSIGIVITDALNTTTEALLKHADTAMYQAKKEGRGISSFYRPEMDRLLKRRLKLHNSLHSAIKHNELQLYYQPIVNFATNKIIGAEALLRWENREIGRISPDEFIPIAEEGGFIIPIGTWVLHEACKHLAQWQSESAEGLDLQKISVNVSSKQFSEPEFVTKVLDAIKQSGINPNHLELELTESIIVDDIDAVIRKMQLLRSHGIGISMDDFGTGYSSLSYLKKLPFSTLKIDKSFTQDIQTDINDAELIRSIITIAKTFHLKVIAEGVETMQQHDFLLQNECCCYQGYFCTPALPSAAFSDFIKKYHASKIF